MNQPAPRVLSVSSAVALLALLGCGAPPAEEEPGSDTTAVGGGAAPAAGAGGAAESDRPFVQASSPVEAGRYLVRVAGCNDCHTPGYLEAAEEIPESRYLTGSPVGWRGPWGTTYAVNLRLRVRELSEEEWVTMLQTRLDRPPMPWFNLHGASDRDLRAIYRYTRSLGPAGEPMPSPLPPDAEPEGPYIELVPKGVPPAAGEGAADEAAGSDGR